MRVTVFSVLAAGMSLFIVVGSNPVGVYNAGAAAAQSNTLVCYPNGKPLKTSVLQGWQRCNAIRQELMVKMKTPDCPMTCSKIDPDLRLSEIGIRVGSIVNKMRCLFYLQFRENVLNDNLFMSASNMNDITILIDEIMNKSEICAPITLTPEHKCYTLLKGYNVDSVTIKISDKVYDVGYALTSELQSYLEKLYLQNSRT